MGNAALRALNRLMRLIPMTPQGPEADLTDPKVRSRLKLARRMAGLTQAQAGDALGISDATYSKLERGLVALDSWHLMALAPRLGVSVAWLEFGTPESEGPSPPVRRHKQAEPDAAQLLQRQQILGLLDELPNQGASDEPRELREARELMERCAERLQEELTRYGKLHRVLHAVLGPPESLQRAFDMFAQAYDNLVVMGGAPPREGGVYPQE